MSTLDADENVMVEVSPLTPPMVGVKHVSLELPVATARDEDEKVQSLHVNVNVCVLLQLDVVNERLSVIDDGALVAEAHALPRSFVLHRGLAEPFGVTRAQLVPRSIWMRYVPAFAQLGAVNAPAGDATLPSTTGATHAAPPTTAARLMSVRRSVVRLVSPTRSVPRSPRTRVAAPVVRPR